MHLTPTECQVPARSLHPLSLVPQPKFRVILVLSSIYRRRNGGGGGGGLRRVDLSPVHDPRAPGEVGGVLSPGPSDSRGCF